MADGAAFSTPEDPAQELADAMPITSWLGDEKPHGDEFTCP
jgi:hypothetical protein